MRTFSSVIFVNLLVSGCAAVIHERRTSPLEKIQDRRRIEQDAFLPMRIGLRPNIDAIANGEAWLRDVSDPDSSNYGQYWKQEQVIEAFKPSDEAFIAVEKWLASQDIEHFIHTDNGMWIAFDLPAAKAETLLQTQYFEHFRPVGESESGRFEVSCDQYHVPEELQKHIDFIKPGIVPAVVTGRSARSRDFLRKFAQEGLSHQSKHSAGQKPKHKQPPFLPDNLEHCNVAVSPACVRTLYNFSILDPSLSVSSTNHMGIYQNLEWARQDDLNAFWSFYTDIPKDTSPIMKAIDGAVLSAKEDVKINSSIPNPGPYPIWTDLAEATGDVECAQPIIYPQNVTIFQEDDFYWSLYANVKYSSWYFNDFLDAIDGSFCRTSELKASYPNATLPTYPDPRPYGYNGKLECGVFKPTNIMSISYNLPGVPEYHLAYKERECLEFLKLSLQGVSTFAASGDYGVGPCYNETWHDQVFANPFPAACPWVTSVGATKIAPNKTVFDPEITTGWSGGGFSFFYDRPWYQDSAVKNYFDKYDPKIPYFYGLDWKNTTGRYNRNGRGYPDISAVGRDVDSIIWGSWGDFTGTSAATPIVAALFNRIIEERIRVGKGPLGLINPVLYKHQEIFHDIIGGNNADISCSQGFTCVPGWDPVSGVGTPNYPKMLELFLSLP